MDIRKIKKLIEMLEVSGIAELEITEGEESVRISRYGQTPPMPAMPYPPQAYNLALPPAASAPAAEAAPAGKPAPDGKIIRSPMVGTFYNAPAPDADPFVKLGDDIKAGDTVCIEADFGGKIVEILVENGQPVEYDEPLFVVK